MSELIDKLSPEYQRVVAGEYMEMTIPYLQRGEDVYVKCAVYQLSRYIKGKGNEARLREVLVDLLDHMGEEG